MNVNPLKEFDTELFQTDAREPSKEFPDLSDDSNSIYGDIQNLLRNQKKTSLPGPCQSVAGFQSLEYYSSTAETNPVNL
nr:hypothetical transcript [Hymenolepis microstoma]